MHSHYIIQQQGVALNTEFMDGLGWNFIIVFINWKNKRRRRKYEEEVWGEENKVAW